MSFKNKEVQREYHKKWYAENKEKRQSQIYKDKYKRTERAKKFYYEYLSNHPCVDCGEKDILVLEFDHVSGNKRNGVGILVGRGCTIDTIQKEIDKCEVVCSNDHRRRTHKRNNDSKYQVSVAQVEEQLLCNEQVEVSITS